MGRKKASSERRGLTVSRRAFFRQSLGSGVAASLSAMLPAARTPPPPASSKSKGIVIHVAPPAGSPPFGAPVETSVPFPRGELHSPEERAVVGPDGKPVVA